MLIYMLAKGNYALQDKVCRRMVVAESGKCMMGNLVLNEPVLYKIITALIELTENFEFINCFKGIFVL